MMNPEIKTKTLVALRSGDYQQCRNVLRDAVGYCCLGVVADVCEEPWTKDDRGRWEVPFIQSPFMYYGDKSGLSGEDAGILSNMNDQYGKTFLEIADYIEANL